MRTLRPKMEAQVGTVMDGGDMEAATAATAAAMEATATAAALMEATEQSALIQAHMEAMAALTQALMAASLEFRGVAPMEVMEAAAEVTEAPMEVTAKEAHTEVVTEAALTEADMEAAVGKSDRARPPRIVARSRACEPRRASAIGSLYGQSDPWETPGTRLGNV